jgi:deoxyribose-phosphate aldolase
MTDAMILSHVDHTLLTAVASWDQIKKLCEEAVANKTASVCIPPSYVKRVRDAFGDTLTICTVIGFPLGYDVTAAKVAAAEKALEDGADELDMVINLGDVKNGEFDKVEAEIAALKKAAGCKVLKVIVETCYLTEDEKIHVCGCVTNAGADYIKTSTGFGTGGATMADVLLFREHIGQDVRIKAAGGIRSREDMVAFLDAGCDRLGTSSAIKILAKQQAEGY